MDILAAAVNTASPEPHDVNIDTNAAATILLNASHQGESKYFCMRTMRERPEEF